MQQLLFADQLGPHFDLGGEIILVESLGRLAARPHHWAKAQLILSAIRHRAAESNRVQLVRADSYNAYLDGQETEDFVAINPTSYGFRKLIAKHEIKTLPSRGFVIDEADFAAWVAQRKSKRLLLEDFYRDVRRKTGLLMQGADPVGGQWNFDHENREAPPKGAQTISAAEPWQPVEDEIDRQVVTDLQRWVQEGKITLVGEPGPRWFAVTRKEALEALQYFVEHRLATFGKYEDAALIQDWAMSHSLLSVPMNLGLLDPLEVARAAEQAYLEGKADIASVEGFIRQVVGWRDYVWQLYWHFGEDYVLNNRLEALEPIPESWLKLESSAIKANCVSHSIDKVSKRGWLHHIERLMILGNVAMQRGLHPGELNDWFVNSFVDGTPWVMPANVIGMSQYADGGKMSTKPYAGGGAYISKMTDYCKTCQFDPKVRVGEDACPVTAGYWNFLDKNREAFRGNHRLAQPLAGLGRLKDLDEIRVQEQHRGTNL